MTEVRRKWTEDEDQILLTMRAAGKRPIVIAKELRRTEASVIERTARLKRKGRSVKAVVRSPITDPSADCLAGLQNQQLATLDNYFKFKAFSR